MPRFRMPAREPPVGKSMAQTFGTIERSVCLQEQLEAFHRGLRKPSGGSPVPVHPGVHANGSRNPAVVPEDLLELHENRFIHNEGKYRINDPYTQAQRELDYPIENLGEFILEGGMATPKNKSHLDFTIGQKLETLIKVKGLNAAQLARSAGMDVARLRRLRKGKDRWNSWDLDVVAKALNISPAELLEDKTPGRIHAGMLQAVISGLRKVQATGKYRDLSPETEARLISLLYDCLVEDELEVPEEKTIRRYLELVS